MEHFGGSYIRYRKNRTEQTSYEEILKVMDLIGLSGQYRVFHSAPHGGVVYHERNYRGGSVS